MKTKLILILFVSIFVGCQCDGKTMYVDTFITALEQVESEGDPKAYNKDENAIGILQIRPIMFREYIRLTGDTSLTHQDCYNPEIARRVCRGVLTHYIKTYPNFNAKNAAFLWNGGHRGYRESKRKLNPTSYRKELEGYWKKVNKNLTY